MAIAWPFDSTLTTGADGNPVYNRAYSADVLAAFLKKYFRDGVFASPTDNLLVIADEGMSVSVSPGYANIQGRQYWQSASESVALSSASESLPRIDTVVLRLNLSTNIQNVMLAVVTGMASSVPAAPALTRNSTIWELALADVTVSAAATKVTQSMIADARLDSNRCGIVVPTIGEFDTTDLFSQVKAMATEFGKDIEQWQTVAQQEQQNINNNAQINEDERQSEFEQWFDLIKNTLDENQAGNLLNLINQRAIVKHCTATLQANGWSATEPYEQTVAVDWMTDTMIPKGDVVLSSDKDEAITQAEAWGCVSQIESGNGTVTITCLEEKPEITLNMQIEVVM